MKALEKTKRLYSNTLFLSHKKTKEYTEKNVEISEQSKKDSVKMGLRRLFQWPTFVLKIFVHFSMAAAQVCSIKAQAEAERHCANVKGKVPDVLADLDIPACKSALFGDIEPILQNLSQQIEGLSMSTAFSGIETPGTALAMLGAALCVETGTPTHKTCKCRHKYAVEWNAKARAEIMKHPHSPEHVFGDVEEFWLETIRCKIKNLKENKLIDTVLIPLVKSANCVGTRAWCYKHNTMCKARYVESCFLFFTCEENTFPQ